MTRDDLKPPPDWIDRNAKRWRDKDLSKIPRYTSDLGFDYWPDLPNRGVSTSDANIYFRWRTFWGRDVRLSYGELFFDGTSAIITNDEPGRPNESPKFRWTRDEYRVTHWTIEHLFQNFTVPDVQSYPWLGQAAPLVDVQRMQFFVSATQQARFISLVEALLGVYDTAAHKALTGIRVTTDVQWGEALSKQFKTRELIRELN